MSIAVQCPICQETRVLQDEPDYFFKHCGMTHDLESNTVCRSAYTRVNNKWIRNTEIEKEKHTPKFCKDCKKDRNLPESKGGCDCVEIKDD